MRIQLVKDPGNDAHTKEEIEELDASTPTNLNQNNAPSISELTTDEINYLDENTPETSAIPSTSFDSNGKLQPDYRHPLGDQEDSNGFNHPDAWSNPTDLKDGDIYYQLIPNFKDNALCFFFPESSTSTSIAL